MTAGFRASGPRVSPPGRPENDRLLAVAGGTEDERGVGFSTKGSKNTLRTETTQEDRPF